MHDALRSYNVSDLTSNIVRRNIVDLRPPSNAFKANNVQSKVKMADSNSKNIIDQPF